MSESVKKFVQGCEVCQSNKHSTQRPTGLLQPLENPAKPFQHITMDFVTHLPVSSRGHDAIFSIVDRFSRMCRFIPCSSSMSSLECAQLFWEHWVCRFGMPGKIVSDRDVKFTSGFWQELNRLLGCKVALSTAYHPQTDGLTERFHRSVEQVLRCYCSGVQDQWCSLLSQCEFALNATFQDAVQSIPFQVVYGFAPQLPIDVQLDSIQLPAVHDFVQARNSLQLQVEASLKDAQDRMARVANRARRDMQHEVGDKVWLATKHLPLKTGTRKLAAIWAGPFEVLGSVGPVAYRLLLPESWGVHNVFHVSQLKSVIGSVEQEQALEVETGIEFEVDQVVDTRVSRGRRQYLVKWKGYSDFENQWLFEDDLGNAQQAVQDFHSSLSGKTKTRRGSGVRA